MARRSFSTRGSAGLPKLSRRTPSLRTVSRRITRSVVQRMVRQGLRGEDLFGGSSNASRNDGFSLGQSMRSLENSALSAVLGALLTRPKSTRQQQQETERSRNARQRFTQP